MAIGSEGTDLVAYMVLFIPLEFLMTSRRFNKDGNRQRAVALPLALLAIFAAVKIGYELQRKTPSYYDMMEVAPTAPYAEIKKGYKRMSLKVHPDKVMERADVDEDEASEAFRALKAAYDVLNDSQLRDVYDKFGPAGVESKDDTCARPYRHRSCSRSRRHSLGCWPADASGGGARSAGLLCSRGWASFT